jgi:hypothetical protein
MSSGEDQEQASSKKFSARSQSFLQRLFRDPRYLLIGRIERFGRELIAFVEGCTIISSTGDVRGQVLINSEFELRGRPDGERPFQYESLAAYYLSRGEPIGEDDLAALQEESWQYYVRRNFAFLLEEFAQARDDSEHNLSIWNIFDQADANEDARWSYLRWWPWIERDRAIAQALLNLRDGQLQEAATELYRAQRSIEQFGQRHTDRYTREEEEDKSLCGQMVQHIATLTEILREDKNLPVSMEEQLEQAAARGDSEEVERLRKEMILRAMGDED